MDFVLLLVFIVSAILIIRHEWADGNHSNTVDHDAECDFIQRQDD